MPFKQYLLCIRTLTDGIALFFCNRAMLRPEEWSCLDLKMILCRVFLGLLATLCVILRLSLSGGVFQGDGSRSPKDHCHPAERAVQGRPSACCGRAGEARIVEP